MPRASDDARWRAGQGMEIARMQGSTDRFAGFPRALSLRARAMRLGRASMIGGGLWPDRRAVPALVAHPDWRSRTPVMVWLHGRTASKELDPGRYLRWIRAGFAAVAIDLPGHGERAQAGWDGPGWHDPQHTLRVVAAALAEIDAVVEHVRTGGDGGQLAGLVDPTRVGIGGMSAGGMVTLRRLCDSHDFRCAAVESTCGDLAGLYGRAGRSGGAGAADGTVAGVQAQDPGLLAALDPLPRISAGGAEGWPMPIPLLALHSEADMLVPFDLQRGFLDRLGESYEREAALGRGAGRGSIEFRHWPTTGAPLEHSGFGRVSNDAKNIQTAFLVRHLLPDPVEPF